MDNLKMILFDGTELSVDAFGLPMHAVLTCANEDEMLEKYKQLTPSNLARVAVVQGGETVFAYTGGTVEGMQSIVNPDGTLTVHFYMNGVRQEVVSKTNADYITAAKILLGEEE